MRKTESGQMLLVAVLLLAILIVAIPALIFINQHSASHGMSSQKRMKARTVSEEGLAFVIQQLTLPGPLPSNPWPNWPFSNGTTTIPATLGFDGSQSFPSAQGGGSFKVFTTVPPGAGVQGQSGYIENYQVEVIVRSFDKLGNPIPGSSIAALVSQRTVGVKLPTGLSASVALQLGKIPSFVEQGVMSPFGPVALYDAGTWHIPDDQPTVTYNKPMNQVQNPRKFSVGGLTSFLPNETGASIGHAAQTTAWCIDGTMQLTNDQNASLNRCPNSPTDPDCIATTDNKEYWAFADLGFPPVLDDNGYIYSAQHENNITTLRCITVTPNGPNPPSYADDGAFNPTSCVGNTSCGYFDTTVNTCPNPALDVIALGTPFSTTTGLYSVPNSADVIYVKGPLTMFNTNIDFKPGGVPSNGALIVTGDLTTDGWVTKWAVTPSASEAWKTDIRYPPTEYLEYPYLNPTCPIGPAAPSCHGTGCNTFNSWVTPTEFRGFMWVKGNFTLHSGTQFSMSGVLRVDQTLTSEINSQYWLFYDDEINRKIRTANLELQVDSTASLP